MKKLIHKGRVFTLFRKTTRLPNGNISSIDVIEHNGAVVIVPLLSEDKIVLIKQYRIAIDGYIYELPAGTIDNNEKPVNCAKRELIEEIGYDAGYVKKIGKILPVPGYSNEILHLFVAKKLKDVGSRPEKSEVIEKKIMTRKQVKNLIKKGKIIDAKTISGLYMAGLLK